MNLSPDLGLWWYDSLSRGDWINMIEHSSEEYRLSVARALTGADEGLVFNGTLDHARVVIEEAFKAAKDHVRILAHRLSPACYGAPEVIAAASAFLSRPDTKLDVLVEDASSGAATQPFLATAMSIGGHRVRALQVPQAFVDGYTFNFLTVDGASYRFEEDRSKPIAVVAGGAANLSSAKHLTGLFDRLFASSVPLELSLESAAG